jgi:F-type H+-transporting ATPase subunit epsilon
VTSFRFTVLTPLATVLECDVESVVVPLADGWLGVLPGHAPFAACVMAGEVLVRAGGDERLLATLGGTLSVEPDAVVISTGAAAPDRHLAELEQEIGD